MGTGKQPLAHPTDGLGWYVVEDEPNALTLRWDYRYNLKEAAQHRAHDINRRDPANLSVMFYDGKAWDRSTLTQVTG